MSEVRYRWKNAGFYDLRRAPRVIAALEDVGRSITEAANETLPEKRGYRMSSKQGRKKKQGRWAVRVYTASNHAKGSNARNNTLLKVSGLQ